MAAADPAEIAAVAEAMAVVVAVAAEEQALLVVAAASRARAQNAAAPLVYLRVYRLRPMARQLSGRSAFQFPSQRRRHLV